MSYNNEHHNSYETETMLANERYERMAMLERDLKMRIECAVRQWAAQHSVFFTGNIAKEEAAIRKAVEFATDNTDWMLAEVKV